MAELKTKPTTASVTDFLASVEPEERRRDCKAIVAMMKRATTAKPRMWGPSIVGFGDFRYAGSNGKAVDWFVVGFSPRKKDLTLYLMSGIDRHPRLMKRLGTYTTGKACLYIRRLSDVDPNVLQELIEESVATLRNMNRDIASRQSTSAAIG
jgi:hypothetical protein